MEIERELASLNATLSDLREEISALREVVITSLSEPQKRKLQQLLVVRSSPVPGPRRPAVSPSSLPPTASAASHEPYDSGGS